MKDHNALKCLNMWMGAQPDQLLELKNEVSKPVKVSTGVKYVDGGTT